MFRHFNVNSDCFPDSSRICFFPRELSPIDNLLSGRNFDASVLALYCYMLHSEVVLDIQVNCCF